MFDYDFKFYNISHITNEEFMKKEINVVVTGAAGQIGYSLIPRLIDGNLFHFEIHIPYQIRYRYKPV